MLRVKFFLPQVIEFTTTVTGDGQPTQVPSVSVPERKVAVNKEVPDRTLMVSDVLRKPNRCQ